MNYRLRPRHITYVCITFIALLWFGALAVRAADRYVSPPGGYGTNDTVGGYTNWAGAATNIQWAVNAATSGEKVWVTNGTYALTNEILIANAITVRGVNGQEATFVNGNYPTYTNRCFRITAGAVIDGLTISNGLAVTNSSGGAYGGGVYLNANGAYVQNCTITRNQAYSPTSLNAGGGGIYANQNSYVINCSISYNTADSQNPDYICGGGGIYVNGTGNAIISNCVIFANVAGTPRGGGVNMYGAGLVVNCTIYTNRTQFRGGGVNIYPGGTVRNCVISNNYAGNLGSGISLEYGGLAEGCLLVGNRGSAALQVYYITARNCTVARNLAGGNFTWGDAKFDNVIFYDNTGGNDTSGGGNPPNPCYSNCCWLTGWAPTNWGTGNITNAPMFVNAGAGNYRLANNSPCVNTGTNQSWMTNAVDLDGRMRIKYGIVDIGAYERVNQGTIFMGR